MAAVSARKMVAPSEAEIHPAVLKESSSSCFHPPSGPKAKVASPAGPGTGKTSFSPGSGTPGQRVAAGRAEPRNQPVTSPSTQELPLTAYWPWNGESATEFHIQKPDALPAGKYKVVVSVNGNPVQTKEFEVKAS